MQTMRLEDPMAKKKVVSVQIAEDLVKSLRVVASLTDRQMGAIIDEILRPVITRMELEETTKHARQLQAPPAKPKGGE